MIQFTGPGQKRRLREREKRARRARILEGLAVDLSFREIAAREGLTERRIRQIVAEARQDRFRDDEALRATVGTQGFPALAPMRQNAGRRRRRRDVAVHRHACRPARPALSRSRCIVRLTAPGASAAIRPRRLFRPAGRRRPFGRGETKIFSGPEAAQALEKSRSGREIPRKSTAILGENQGGKSGRRAQRRSSPRFSKLPGRGGALAHEREKAALPLTPALSPQAGRGGRHPRAAALARKWRRNPLKSRDQRPEIPARPAAWPQGAQRRGRKGAGDRAAALDRRSALLYEPALN